MNPDKNYRMTSATKRMCALIRDPVARKIYKDLMIKAELHYDLSSKKVRRAPSRDTAPIEEESASE